MKNSPLPFMLWRRTLPVLLAAALLGAPALSKGADENKDSRVFSIAIAGEGAGTVMGFTLILDDVGEKLLEHIDLNKDGGASFDEFKAALQARFRQWDSDKGGSLSTNELSAGLNGLFPAPEITVTSVELAGESGEAAPRLRKVKHMSAHGGAIGRQVVVHAAAGDPGELPPPPEPSTIVTQRVLEASDTDKDKVITPAEWSALTARWFNDWDYNQNGFLSVDDLADGFHQLAGPSADEDLLFFLPE